MKKTNICIAGNFNLATTCAEFILKKYNNLNIYAVLNSNDKGKDSFQKSYKKYCNNNNIKIINIEEAYKITGLIFISLHYDKIIKTDNFVSKKLFNIHFSLLPKYKGMHTTAWPIINGEKETGITLHKIDNGIDTGDIISQFKFKIKNTDTAQDVFLNYMKYGILVFKKNFNKLLKNNYKHFKQNPINSSYYSKKSINFKKININLNKTAFEIHNQIRGYIFEHYQLPIVKNRKIVKSKILDSKSNFPPGKIIIKRDKKIIISTIDYNLLLMIK